MVTLGIMVGHAVGAMAGKRAEVLGGLVLIGVGVAIAFEHVNAAAGT
jgi:putative Mn2+ efflux pump MntP